MSWKLVSLFAIKFSSIVFLGVAGEVASKTSGLAEKQHATVIHSSGAMVAQEASLVSEDRDKASVMADHDKMMVRREINRHEQEHSEGDAHAPIPVCHNAHISANATRIQEMGQLEDDCVLATDYLCTETHSNQIEVLEGPVDRPLVLCRSACIRDPRCRQYAYYPANHNGKNKAGSCLDQCVLYAECVYHEPGSKPVAEGCSAYVFNAGPRTLEEQAAHAGDKGEAPAATLRVAFLLASLMYYMP
mmetsp:Transcript_100255/g.156639  ORF Transcript_100255/g.156639 Transcript_100255/m.156639 type:complete len:246 (+) Transcript_100255:75-812(+)